MSTPLNRAAPKEAVESIVESPRRADLSEGAGLSIQSKLLIMLLATSIVSALVIGAVGYFHGRESLREAAVDQLTAVREMRAHELQVALEAARTGVRLDSRNLSAQNSARELIEGWNQLADTSLTPAQYAELETYYTDSFLPRLSKYTGDSYSSTAFVPDSNAGKYLQYWYVRPGGDDFDEKLATTDPGDGSRYSAAHARFHDYYQRVLEAHDYEDILLIDLDGNVVYTAYKEMELGTNLDNGPFRESKLAAAYHEVISSNSVNTTILTDFEPWLPSLDFPAMWAVSPIGNDSEIIGVMAVQVSIDAVNKVLTGDYQWVEQGLGKTGEVYVAGRDDTLRSVSRMLVEDPERFAELSLANGTPSGTVQRMLREEGSVLLQPTTSSAVDAAQRGQTGVVTNRDYLGGESISAYRPLRVEGLDWVVVARISTGEAFAAVNIFTRNLLLSTLGLLVAVSLVSLLLAQVFARPIRRLASAARQVSAGDLGVRVPSGGRDEIAELGAAFNDMAESLLLKQDLLDQQQSENDRLMSTLMPREVADRYRKGEEAIAQSHENVSVVYAELVGFDEFARSLGEDEEIKALNELMRGFDDAAQQAGVEKVRTLRGGYLASSGRIVPRIDNARRAVDFAKNMRDVTRRFNAQYNANIDVRAGVDTGTVTSGLVARTSLAYDLWGDAVNLAFGVRTVTQDPGVYVSDAVKSRLQESMAFEQAGTVLMDGKDHAVWRVIE